MTRRLIAAAAAVLLAVLGAVVLIDWVRDADARAQADEQLVDVLVIDSEVAAGTRADDLGSSVSVEQVPERLVAPGAVTALSEVTGQIATASLLPGEQLVTGRFAEPAALAPAGTVPAPEGTVEVTVALDAQRAVGGVLEAGDKVGVQLTNETAADGGVTAYSVYEVMDGVLVTRVVAPADDADPAATHLITLALEPQQAQRFVLGTSSQAIWLSLQEASPVSGGVSTVDTSTTVTLGDDQ
jgi:pilus assembly protein CpaB